MNERIKDLAKQANIHFSRVGILDGDPNGSARIVGYSKMEKFAELIVRECAVYCEGHILPKGMAEEHGVNYNDGVMDCAIGLLQHFGVEE